MDTLAAGDILYYHGSKVDYHGYVRFDMYCGECKRCHGGSMRLRITHLISDEELYCVRLGSVSRTMPEIPSCSVLA